ncbi:MAG TPA: hypothetical protein VGN88_02050 [Phycisphaerae bacterium]|jgi:hypothetical protein
METPTPDWLIDISNAMHKHGGCASLQQIYRYVHQNRSNLPAEYEAVVRASIYAHSTDAKAYKKGNPDIFIRIRRGMWGMRFPEDFVPGRSNKDLRSIAFTNMLREMNTEAMQSLAGRPGAFEAEINRRIMEVRRKYHIS